MSTKMTDTDIYSAAEDAAVPAATMFQLIATNSSSVSGQQFFNVYPPSLTNPPTSQKLIPLVSDPTDQAEQTILSWEGGAGALALFAVAGSAVPDDAVSTPVALGDIVAVDWVDGAFTFDPAPGGAASAIELTFGPAVPAGTELGLVVGPGAILVPLPVGLSPLTLTPDLSLTATVIFGTAYQYPGAQMSDVSWPRPVTFTLGAAVAPSTNPTATAQIKVGLDNLIVDDPAA